MPTTVTGVNPTNCSIEGGEAITITGTQFLAGATVTFGGVAATNVQVNSAVDIVATAPARTRAGAVDVVVTNANGTHGTGVNVFQYWCTLTTIEPATGTAAGGTPVTLTGKGFPAGATVQIGGAAAGAVVVNPAGTQITATTPGHAPGAADVYVYPAAGGLGGGRTGAFHYSAPAITGLEPLAAPAAGGVGVTLRGDFFAAGATVTFGGVATAAPPVIVSAQEMTMQAPAHAPGKVDVIVTVAGQATTLAAAFEYQGATITDVAPARGPAAGGTDITITGTAFDTAAAPTVQVGGVAVANLVVVDATTITARTAAAAAGKVDVTVQNPGHPVVTKTEGFKLVAAPTVTAVKPARGGPGGGTPITISGTNFANNATVTVGGVAATGVTVVSATTITATTAAHGAGNEAVAVTNPGAPAVALDASFTFSQIDRLEPARGLPAGGEQVVIHGSGFIGAVTVTFDGDAAAAVTVDSPQQLTVTTPPHAAGTVDVAVTVAAHAVTLAGGFEFSPVTELDPPGGPIAGNTQVTLRGDGFPADTTVHFGATAAANVQRISAQELRATTAAAAAGPVDVVLQADAFAVTVAQGFVFRAVATVAAIEPDQGVLAGGTRVTITGTGFVEAATVTIGGGAATEVTVVSDTTLTATTPFGPPPPMGGGPRPAYDVVVTNPGDAAVTGAGLFRFRDPPRVDAVAPATGPVIGDRWITVTGRDYVDGAVVRVGAADAPQTVFHNAQTLYARVPAHAVGAVDIAVRNPGEAAGPSRVGGFTYVAVAAETGENEVVFLLDGENYFEELRVQFEAVRQSAPHELTYVRLAYWMIEKDVTLGDGTYFEKPNHQLLVYIDQLIRAGHNVDVIVWCPSKHHRFQMGAEMAKVNGEFGHAVYEVDRAAAAAGPHVGRARAFLEPYEGEVGASNHQKMAIFSIEGVRTVCMGGLNLSNHYFAPDDHSGG
ncbi:MAG: IPT/TIG domain-containing protein, partial [Deltaproteobacteria bacterium]|nr:IPT/TIG domain-containing protein [Deltaproteobacteria bacterium]